MILFVEYLFCFLFNKVGSLSLNNNKKKKRLKNKFTYIYQNTLRQASGHIDTGVVSIHSKWGGSKPEKTHICIFFQKIFPNMWTSSLSYHLLPQPTYSPHILCFFFFFFLPNTYYTQLYRMIASQVRTTEKKKIENREKIMEEDEWVHGRMVHGR